MDWEHLLPPKGFQILPRRWVVERTFSWIDQNRRMSKDYEKLCASGEAFVYAAMSRLMLRRLAHTRLFHTVSLGTSVNKSKKRKDRARRRRSGVLVENKDSGPPFGQDESLLL